jgi:hypothetical protein
MHIHRIAAISASGGRLTLIGEAWIRSINRFVKGGGIAEMWPAWSSFPTPMMPRPCWDALIAIGREGIVLKDRGSI